MFLRPFGLYCSTCFGILFVSINKNTQFTKLNRNTQTYNHIYKDKKWNQKNMKDCDERRSHKSSKHHMIYILVSSNNDRHPVTKTFTPLHYTSPNYTSPNYTSLHFTTLHPTTLHSTSLHFTQLHFTPLHYTCRHITSPI